MASRGKVGHFLKSTEINDLQNRIQFKISAYMDYEEELHKDLLHRVEYWQCINRWSKLGTIKLGFAKLSLKSMK